MHPLPGTPAAADGLKERTMPENPLDIAPIPPPDEGPDDDDQSMPLPQDAKTIFLAGLFLLACLTALYVAREILLPIVLAVVLKLLLQPLVRLLERIRIPRGVAALISLLVLLMVLSAVGTGLTAPAAGWAAKLPQALTKLADQVPMLAGPLKTLQDALTDMLAFTKGGAGAGGTWGTGFTVPAALFSTIFDSTRAALAGLFTTLLILFYLLVFGEIFLRRLVEILPRFRDKREAVELSTLIERDLSAYLLTVTAINAVVGFATLLIMWITGVANPVLWGVTAFLLNFVPILGPMVGIVLFCAVGVLSIGVIWWALLPAGLYLVVHLVEGEWVTPMLMARRFTVNPVAVVLGLVFWYWMWGVVGAILAVPMLAIVKLVCDRLRPLRAFGHFLEG